MRRGRENGRVLVVGRGQRPRHPTRPAGLIFERFGRAHVGLGKPGSGLGLFIARSIAEAHGGTLEVRSAPGRGRDVHARAAGRRRYAGGWQAARERGDAELFAERLSRASRSRGGARAARAARPRRGSARISPTSHSGLPTFCSLNAEPSESGVGAALDLPAGDGGRVEHACDHRVVQLARLEALARLERLAATASRCACGRAGSCARRHACGPRCARTSAGAGARSCTARRDGSSACPPPPSGTRSRRGAGGGSRR